MSPTAREQNKLQIHAARPRRSIPAARIFNFFQLLYLIMYSFLYSPVQYCTVLYSTVQYSVQYCTVLYSTVQYCTVLYSTV